jgi:nucleotide-binding universal stress UspA family protein
MVAAARRVEDGVMTKILIGVDGSERSEDAVAFGRMLALASGAPVVLARGIHAHDTSSREDAEAALIRLAAPLDDVGPVELRAVANRSGAHALQEIAEQEDIGIIVIGSSHTGRLGRVLPGSTAERLLHGAPCPVAVVPLGYRDRGTPQHPVVGCAYRPTEDGEAALGAAEELALALSASLRVMNVVEPLSHIYGTGEVPLNFSEMDASIRAEAERSLNERVARLSANLETEGTQHVGRPADVLAGLSKSVDLLVVGSRGYGPIKAVLVGGVSGQVIRSAACPVVVVPRRARSAAGSVFASAA